MKSENIRDIIESKLNIYKEQGIDISKYNIDELVKGFIDIGSSLLEIKKDTITDENKKQISTRINIRLNNLFSGWFLDFIKGIIDLNISNEDIKLSTKNIDILYIYEKINEYVLFANKQDNHIPQNKLSFYVKNILIDNFGIVIDYINEKSSNKKIISFKNILLDFYKKVSYFIDVNNEIIEKSYENGRLFLADERKLSNLIKISDKLNLKSNKSNNMSLDLDNSNIEHIYITGNKNIK